MTGLAKIRNGGVLSTLAAPLATAELRALVELRLSHGGGYALLINGDPPSRHFLAAPRLVHSFRAAFYHEACAQHYTYME